MINSFKLLIVEDDKDEIIVYKDTIKEFNKENEDFQIVPDIKENLEDGLSSLNSNQYDGAILDLRINKTKIPGEEAEGNKILREIKKSQRIPVIVHSGFTGDLDPSLLPAGGFLKIITRGEVDFYDNLKYFKDITSSGVFELIGEQGSINEFLMEAFWNRVSIDIDYWMQQNVESRDLKKILSRFIINYLHEKLDLNDDGDFETYHPAEIYIIPSVREKLFTGDILSKEDKNYVILMPPCDMANDGKVDYAVIGNVEDLNFSHIRSAKRVLGRDNRDEAEKAKVKIQRLINNTYSLNYHFLPRSSSFPGGFIDFRKVQSVKITDLKDNYSRIGSISGAFIKDVLSRFSQYYARQGQPKLDTEKIYEEIIAN